VNKEGKILHGISYGLELEKFYDVFDKNEEQ
jgi:hypothetical protein